MDWALGSLEASGLLFSSYIFYQLQKRQTKLLNMLEFMDSATVFSPKLLRKIMSSDGPKTYLKSLKEFEEGGNYSRGIGFVLGTVNSDRAIRSILNHTSKLVLSTISTESIFSNNRNQEEGEGDGKIETRYTDTFFLEDERDKSEKIELSNNTGVRFGNSLNIIDSTTSIRSLTSLERFMSWALFCIKLFLSMSNVGKKISGFRVGSQRIERGILVGQFLVAFGEIIYDKKTKELRMDNPICYLKDKAQLINSLKNKSVKISRNLTLIFSLMTILSFLIVRRIRKGVISVQKKYRRMRELKKMDKLFKISRLMTDDFKCIICIENAKNVILKPCLHMCVCSICCSKLDGKCPMCRKEIEDKVTIYIN